jgi:hypothetical protein
VLTAKRTPKPKSLKNLKPPGAAHPDQ